MLSEGRRDREITSHIMSFPVRSLVRVWAPQGARPAAMVRLVTSGARPRYYPGSKEGHIPTQSASEGSGAFPSLARRVNMQQHAELPCRGNSFRPPGKFHENARRVFTTPVLGRAPDRTVVAKTDI